MRRFHQFETSNGTLTIDLDSICAWMPLGHRMTDVFGPGWTHRVHLHSTDVARLVNPPAARTILTMDRCYVFDLDGTLADLSHRLHHIQKEPKDWRSFFAEVGNDELIQHMADLFRTLKERAYCIIVSGRSDECEEATREWLRYHYVWPVALYMRKAGDHRPDHVVKRELLDQMRADGFEPIMVFDDRDQVVKMWREAGIPCAQVAEGSF